MLSNTNAKKRNLERFQRILVRLRNSSLEKAGLSNLNASCAKKLILIGLCKTK